MALLPDIPMHLVLGIVSAIITILSSALLLWRRGQAGAKPEPSKGTQGLKAAKANGSAKHIEDPSLLDPSKPVCRILYGTQTGTAERFAKQLGKELKKKYGDSTIIDTLDIENYDSAVRLPNEKLLVLCMATYGDGEPTDNATTFYNWLVKEGASVTDGEKEPYLKTVQYAVFGLGNKQYEHFNKMGKQVHKLLGVLGASSILRCGEGDDDASIDEDFDKWCLELHAVLDARPELLGAKQEDQSSSTPYIAAAYDVTVSAPGSGTAMTAFTSGSGLEAHHPFNARVLSVRELHGPGSERSCVHAEIDVSGSSIQYAHGDHLAIHAQNSAEVVEELAKMLGTDLESVVTLRKPKANTASSPSPLPDPPTRAPVTLRTLLAYFADVFASPHKEALLALAAAAKDPAQAQRLTTLASTAGKDEYAAYIGKTRRSLLEVMREFPSARPTLGVFFASVAPRLQPRFYSISSSPAAHPSHVHVTCAVVRELTPTGRTHHGVASSWLHSCIGAGGALVPVFMRRSHFKLPPSPSTPVIMVGPGTGLAPFRGFLQERAALQQSGSQLGLALLFFGCRNRTHDFIYREELEGWQQAGVLSSLHVAFSRDGPSKDYVQHHMEREGTELWRLLAEQGAHLYVCGDAKAMARDVHRTLLALVQKGKQCSGTQAEGWVKELQDAGRYQRDVW